MGKGLEAIKGALSAFVSAADRACFPDLPRPATPRIDEHAAGFPGPQRVVVVVEEHDYNEGVEAVGFSEPTFERAAPPEAVIVWTAREDDDPHYGDAALGIG